MDVHWIKQVAISMHDKFSLIFNTVTGEYRTSLKILSRKYYCKIPQVDSIIIKLVHIFHLIFKIVYCRGNII